MVRNLRLHTLLVPVIALTAILTLACPRVECRSNPSRSRAAETHRRAYISHRSRRPRTTRSAKPRSWADITARGCSNCSVLRVP